MNRESIYYPHDEMRTALLPVTIGCEHNRCAFCMMYSEDEYSIVPITDIEIQLKNMDLYTERLFLTGADPLTIGFEKMEEVLDLIRKYLPYCACVAAYASVRTISRYTVEKLSILHDKGLRLLYIGFESGSDEALKFMRKGHTAEQAIEEAKKLNKAKLSFNTIVMLGIAGDGKGMENALLTAEMVNQFVTSKIVTMNLTVFHGTELEERVRKGEFILPSGKERLIETITLLQNLDPKTRTEFDTTHPTNAVNLRGFLPEEKERFMRELMKFHD